MKIGTFMRQPGSKENQKKIIRNARKQENYFHSLMIQAFFSPIYH
jgi:hypothetical protein